MSQITAPSPERLGYYCLLRRLGYGGMSEIYLAYDELRQRNVALKVVDAAQADHAQRFQCEVETLMRLSHEHIVPLYDWGKQDDYYFFSMPYYAGGSLRERLSYGPLSLDEAGNIFEQVAGALHCAHEHGILHRDIKPSNVLFGDERTVYLADFGLARLVEQEGGITQTGCLIGTPEYLAPELVTEPASQKSDIYALGVLLYRMLTGRLPFKGATPLILYWKHASEPPVRPSSLNPLIPPAIDDVILRALAKDPADRLATAWEMATAYRQVLRTLRQPRSAGELRVYLAYRRQLAQARLQSIMRFLRLRIGENRRAMFFRLSHGAGVCAMVVLFCVAPLVLGFSLSRNVSGQAEQLAGLQPVTILLAAQPKLQGRSQHPARGASLSSLAHPVETVPHGRTSVHVSTRHTTGERDKHGRGGGEKRDGGHGRPKGEHHSPPGKPSKHGKK